MHTVLGTQHIPSLKPPPAVKRSPGHGRSAAALCPGSAAAGDVHTRCLKKSDVGVLGPGLQHLTALLLRPLEGRGAQGTGAAQLLPRAPARPALPMRGVCGFKRRR